MSEINNNANAREQELPSSEELRSELKRVNYKSKYKKILMSTVYGLVIVAALAALVATLVLPVIEISGNSMEPTLNEGEIIVLVKTSSPERGELCAFSYSNKTLVKRVIGIPGDYIDIDSEGNVYVNGELLEEPYVINKSLGECDISFPFQVPENQYFVLGDQRDTSVDSRSSVIGCVTKEQLVGRLAFRVWPMKRISFVD